MKINSFIILMMFAAVGCNDFRSKKRAKQPNIIYILADDLGYGDVSCYNTDSKFATPNIDHLAARGIRFTDAHTSSAVCTPTRYGILTGRYNWRSRLKRGVLSGYSTALIEEGRLTVGKMLQEVGYHTAFVGKWHLGWDWQRTGSEHKNPDSLALDDAMDVDFEKPIENGPNDRGFDYAFGFSGSLDMPPYVYVENRFATTVPIDTTVSVDAKGFWRKGLTGSDFSHADVLSYITDQSIKYIDHRVKSEQPFFLYLALPAPHTPILPTQEFMGKSNTNFYGDFVLQVDAMVGRITESVKNHGIDENTIVIFTSDNGCSPTANFSELRRVGHYSSYIFRGHKADIYEGGHRVPFILSWPKTVKRTIISDEVICTTDFMRTVADVVGYELPSHAAEDSYSILPILKDEEYTGQLREATVHHSIDGRFAIRKDDWKLILWPGSGGWSKPRTWSELEKLPPFQLYNLKDDPSEEQNRVDDFPEIVTKLKTLLASYVTNGRSTPGAPQRSEEVDNWPEIEWIE